MKRLLLFMITVCLWLGDVPCLLAQEKVPQDLVTAFGKGNSKLLGQYLGQKVDVIIEGKTSEGVVPVAAQGLMAQFFVDNKTKGFVVNHQGQRDETGFVVGTLSTATGSYRVHCFFRRSGDSFLIHQIRIDKTND